MNQVTITPNANVGTLYVKDLFGDYRVATVDQLIAAAKLAISTSVQRGVTLSSPRQVKDFLILQMAGLEHEVFGILFVDSQHQVIVYKELFRGTLNQASVYPREVVKEALSCNAGAAILVHNHPSGCAEPSRADELLTRALKDALQLVDVRVLDHIIVGGAQTVSFLERGLL